MIVCKKCNTANVESAVSCKDCGAPLANYEAQGYEKRIEKVEISREKKIKRKKLIKLILSIIYLLSITGLVLMNIVFHKGSITLIVSTIAFILAGYICINKPELIFIITHLFSVRDVSGEDMSDMYETLVIVAGYLIYTYALINLILNYVELI